MDINLITALIGVGSGAIGYWFTTFSVQPILRYLKVRSRIHADFIYYAQVIKADHLNDEMQVLHRQKILANRRASADLSATYIELPFWYRRLLQLRGQNPEIAARNLIGYSNTTDYDNAHDHEERIKKSLNLPRGN